MGITAASLGMGAGGVVLGGAALAWEVYTWRYSGPRVSESAYRAHLYRGLPTGDLEAIVADAQVTTITVTNHGRASAFIGSYGFMVRGDGPDRYRVLVHHAEPALPAEVRPQGAIQLLALDPEMIPKMVAHDVDRARAYVLLTTGKEIVDDKEIVFGERRPEPVGSPDETAEGEADRRGSDGPGTATRTE